MIDLLRRPLEEIRRVQDARLVRMLALCAQGHPHYRRRWREAGVHPDAIRGVADLDATAQVRVVQGETTDEPPVPLAVPRP